MHTLFLKLHNSADQNNVNLTQIRMAQSNLYLDKYNSNLAGIAKKFSWHLNL